MRSHAGNSTGWLIHDLLFGAAAGGLGGYILGIIVMAQTSDSWLIGGMVIGLGVLISVLALRFERNRRPHAGMITLIVWIILIGSVVFLAMFRDALDDLT